MRNTPTCVGKTTSGVQVLARSRKHPHVRGEDAPGRARVYRPKETPPRAWGRQPSRALRGGRPGNTPTCVGKTVLPCLRLASQRKHPHVRGEDLSSSLQSSSSPETPPRAWGRRPAGSWPRGRPRNTPTCVGKTDAGGAHGGGLQKHPHVRGEDRLMGLKWRGNQETPPRAWGRPPPPSPYMEQERNTPTCVGKTTRLPLDTIS